MSPEPGRKGSRGALQLAAVVVLDDGPSFHEAAGTMSLFEPYSLGELRLRNRVVMAPMTRNRAPGNVPRRLEHGLPLSIPNVETFYAGGDKGYADYPALP